MLIVMIPVNAIRVGLADQQRGAILSLKMGLTLFDLIVLLTDDCLAPGVRVAVTNNIPGSNFVAVFEILNSR